MKHSTSYVLLLSVIAAIGGFLFGFDSGVVNGTVEAIKKSFGTDAAATGFAVGSALIGCAVGAFAAGSLADRLGRRPAMFVTAIIFLASALLTGAANDVYVFIAGRVLGGLAIGAASILTPMYISEIAPPQLRGRLSSLQQLAIVLGLFIVFVSNYLIAAAAGGASERLWFGFQAWRWMFWMEAVPSIAFSLGLFVIPESPRHLVAIGRIDEARTVFAHLSANPDELIARVQESIRGETKPRLSDLIDRKTGHIAGILWIGIGLAAFQQFVGINVIFYYGDILWQAAGASSSDSLKINVLMGAVNIVSTLIAIALIDKVGRKPLLLWGSIGMVVTLGLVAITFARSGVLPDGKPDLTQGAATFAIVCMILYIVAFATSWGPAVWVLLGEIFPNRLRGAALAVSGASNWLANFTVTVTFPPLLAGAGLAPAYAVYAVAALVSAVFVFFAVQETKGKALEEM